jgi:hypothetical protein
MIGQDLVPLLEASVELNQLRKENRALRKEIADLRRPRIEFELSADETPALCRRQAG